MTAAVVVIGVWTVLAVMGCLALHRARRAPADGTVRAAYPPPVPPSRPSDEDWLTSWSRAEQSLFDDIARGEFA